MHNECSVQEYKETNAERWVQNGRTSIRSFDLTWTERQREREREIVEDIFCCDSGCSSDHTVFQVVFYENAPVKVVYIPEIGSIKDQNLQCVIRFVG